jgi:putative flavoprotein involved in K+ transport
MEDLFDAGRHVFLAVSRAGRRPRRYRGRDSSWWNNAMGGFDRTVNDVPDLKVRFGASAYTSGTKGGHDIHLRAFARDGVQLLGRFAGFDGSKAHFANDLQENLAYADEHAARWRRGVDRFVAEQRLHAPVELAPEPSGLERYPERLAATELDLRTAGVSTIIWATGFGYDFSWIKLPVVGERGYPVQRRGETAWPGFYFTGLHWMYSAKSAQFIGVGEDASYIAEHIYAGRRS